jgi:thiol:disulfide interchange protein DsbD
VVTLGALALLSRILPPQVPLWLWMTPQAALVVILTRATFRTRGGRLLARGVAAAVGVYAVLIGVGAVRGATDPLRPLQAATAQVQLPFQRIKSVDELTARIAQANAAGQTVMLDFYADWCVSCKEMEHYTFPTPAVRAALANTLWLQADVTANDATDQALLKHMGIYGPPTIAFYGLDGQERRQYRVVGFMKAGEFATLAGAALK